MNVADDAAAAPEVNTAVLVAIPDTNTSSHEFVALPNLLIKDEPQDDPEMTESALTLTGNANEDDDDGGGTTTSEADPMNLLEPAEERDFYEVRSEVAGSVDDEEKDSDVAGDELDQNESQTTAVESTTSARNEEKWQPWLVQQQSWLFNDDEDPDWAYCLYCDVRITCKNKNYNHARQHRDSIVHKDREVNYIAFQSYAEKANEGSPTVDIKQEFGTSNSTEAIKLKRVSQTVPFNNFNWRRWLQAHDWLVRDMPEGFLGYCKFCSLRLNVEFSYQRERHEMSKKHKDAARVFKYNQEKKAKASKGAEPMETGAAEEEEEEGAQEAEEAEGEEDEEQQDADEDDNEEEPQAGELIVPNTVRSKFSSNPWFQPLPNSTFCQCRLCDCKMIIPSFRKHIKSKIHLENLRYNIAKNKSVKQEFQNNRNWNFYQKDHPWLVADPKDAQFAYCKICERRQMYGYSSIKRTQHENSVGHREAVKQKQAPGESEEQEADTEAEENDHENEEETEKSDEEASNAENESAAGEENEEDNEDEENDNDDAYEDSEAGVKRKRLKRGSDAWFEMFPWCERIGKNTHKFQCTYCNSVLAVETRSKHAKGYRHIENEKKFQQLKKVHTSSGNHYERSLKDKRVHYYPWLVYAKNNPKVVFCKYCRVRYSNSMSRVQHQTTKRHIEAAKQYFANNKHEKVKQAPSPSLKSRSPSPSPSPAPVDAEPEDSKPKAKALPPTTPPSMHGKVLLWKNRFPWLSYKRNELRPNYGYCKYCDQRIFVPTLKFAAKHQRSSKHIRSRLLLKRQRKENESEERPETEQPQTDAEERQQGNNSHAEIGNTSAVAAAAATASPDEERQMAEAWQALQKKYPWLQPDKNDHKEFGCCKWCDTRIPLKAMNLVHHENSNKHRHSQSAEKLRQQRGAVNKTSETDSDGDMIMPDDNAEADEDDADDMSTKSESMDDGGLSVLQLLLDRTMNAKQQQPQQLTNSAAAADDANELPPAKRQRTNHDKTTAAAIDTARQLTAAHGELLRLTRQFSGGGGGSSGSDKRQKRARNSLPASLLTSSFSIAACLSPLMQQLAAPQPPPQQLAPAAALPALPAPPATPTAPLNTFDLFFDSVSETVKKLPSDLAAEARMRVMQIIYDLELRAMRRLQPNEPYNTVEMTATPSRRATEVGSDSANGSMAQSSPEAAAAATLAPATATLANGFENGEHSNSAISNNKTICLSSENSFHMIPMSNTPPRANASAANVSPPAQAHTTDSFLSAAPTPAANSTFTNSALSSSVDKSLRRIQLNAAVQITPHSSGGPDASTSSTSTTATSNASTTAASIRCIPINTLTQSGTRAPGSQRTAQPTATTPNTMPRAATKYVSVAAGSVKRAVNLQGQQIVVSSSGGSPSNVTNTSTASSSSSPVVGSGSSTPKQFATVLHAPARQFRT